MIGSTSTQRIAHYVTALPEQQLKAAMLVWLTHEQPSIDDLADTLAQEQAALEVVDAAFEESAFRELFPPMSEAEMVAASLQAHEEHMRTGEGYTQSEMESWVEELAAPSPCPS
jgi:hypothetical protein